MKKYTDAALARYRKVFSLAEIEADSTLQLVFGAVLFLFFLTFFRGWTQSPALTTAAYLNNTYVCWPYFQECGKYFFLTALPNGYSQSFFYTILLAIMFFIAWAIYEKKWTYAHLGLTLIWIWKFVVVFVLSTKLAQNFDYYDIILAFVLLFLPYKLFFLRVTFVSFYFIAASVKFDAGWILGTYFTSLKTGLPLFGNALAPLLTNLVIFFEGIGCWLLFTTSRPRIRWTVFAFFVVFHVYSTILISYRFPTAALLMLILLFGISTPSDKAPVDKKSLAGWIFLALLFCIQFFPVVFIRGDQKMTLEGNKYGLYMFEANHQCISTFDIYTSTGKPEHLRFESIDARTRCDPYAEWFWAKQECTRSGGDIVSISWQFDHSVNGGPFYRIVDTSNACALEYKAFTHNEWVLLPEEGAAVIGYPVKNVYY